MKRIDSGEIIGIPYDADDRVSVRVPENMSSFKWFEVDNRQHSTGRKV
jgi:hypothetical protein